jgi:hypothetical protein
VEVNPALSVKRPQYSRKWHGGGVARRALGEAGAADNARLSAHSPDRVYVVRATRPGITDTARMVGTVTLPPERRTLSTRQVLKFGERWASRRLRTAEGVAPPRCCTGQFGWQGCERSYSLRDLIKVASQKVDIEQLRVLEYAPNRHVPAQFETF